MKKVCYFSDVCCASMQRVVHGYCYSLDWNTGLDYLTGKPDWTTGLNIFLFVLFELDLV